MKELQKRKLVSLSLGFGFAASLGLLLGLGSSVSVASESSDSFEGRYLQSRAQEITLPETCKSPYRDAPNFLEFFNTSIYVLAAQKGANAAGVSELFAVENMREKLRELFPSSGEVSPMDRLIVAQLCLFEKVQVERLARPGASRIVIAPTDKDLQEHLMAIGPRLYQDARTLMIEALALRARERKQNLNLQRQWDEVRKARRLGNDKVKDLLKDEL